MLPEGPIAIVNLTRGTTLACTARHAVGPLRRLIGLLERATLPTGAGLILTPCTGLHTIGMRFPIDLVYLQRDGADRCGGVVMRLRESLGPFRVALACADLVIELPVGTIARTATAVGDRITLRTNADWP